jgi:hypothetical protein
MVENSFVQMLRDVASGEVADVRDLGLAVAAGEWALAGNHPRWQADPVIAGYLIPGNGIERWVGVNEIEQELEVRVRIDGSRWQQHATHRIAHVGHALDVLAAEELIPARFSTLGRRALEDQAESLDRAAARLSSMADDAYADESEIAPLYGWELRIRSATLSMAADRARAFPRGELAVP